MTYGTKTREFFAWMAEQEAPVTTKEIVAVFGRKFWGGSVKKRLVEGGYVEEMADQPNPDSAGRWARTRVTMYRLTGKEYDSGRQRQIKRRMTLEERLRAIVRDELKKHGITGGSDAQ